MPGRVPASSAGEGRLREGSRFYGTRSGRAGIIPLAVNHHHFDIIIIGSGAGGGTMARALADTSARILIVERGDFVPQEAENWDPEAVCL